MPELPEVESVRSGLEQLVVGKVISSIDVYWNRIISEPENIQRFQSACQGQKIESINRRGKFLLFVLTDFILLSHLRMEGKYIIANQSEPLTKHTHVIFHLSNGEDLRYLDVRKFGRMALLKKGQEKKCKALLKLGPEPIASDFLFAPFQQFLQKRTKAIKGVLLDQQVVAGVGNIYADEILFEAGIHPTIPANQLSEEQMLLLHQAILDVMERAVKAGGTTIRSYQNAFGQEGNYQQSLLVYGQVDQPCVSCGTAIQKIKISQRGTHFCPKCQPEWNG